MCVSDIHSCPDDTADEKGDNSNKVVVVRVVEDEHCKWRSDLESESNAECCAAIVVIIWRCGRRL